MTDAPRKYTREETEEIFRRALARADSGEMDLDEGELIEAARQAGIDPGAVEEAMRELEEGRADEGLIEKHVREKRTRFARSLASYLIVNAAMLGLHFVGLLGVWVWWMVFGWGLLVALQGAGALLPISEAETERVKRRHARRRAKARKAQTRSELRAAAKARRKAQEHAARERANATSRAAQEFETAVERGVAALLTAAARSIERAAEDAGKSGDELPSGEFGDYVARKKGRAARSEVRVDPAVDEVEGGEHEESERTARARRGRRR